jgi:hypothetical protein
MEIKGYVYAKPSEFDLEPIYQFWSGVEPDGSPCKYWIRDGYVPVMPHTIAFEPVDPKALVEGQVVCLLARREKLETEFKSAVKQIDDALANLKCIEA